MESSLCRHTYYADSRGSSLERTRQTTAGVNIVDTHASVVV